MLFKVFSLLFFFLSLFFLVVYFFCIFSLIHFIIEINLLEYLSLDLTLYFFIDWMSSLFMFIVYFISSLVIYYSSYYMSGDKDKNYFTILVVLFVFSMNLFILCSNLFIVLLGWDGLGLISYCLVIFYKNETSFSSGMITVMTNRLGDTGLIISVVMVMMTGMMNFFDLNEDYYLIKLMIITLILGSFTKSAQIPFSVWLPAAMAAPTPVSALVHSSTLVTAGVYMLIRFNKFFDYGLMSNLLMELSIFTMFLSGLCAMCETDLKKIIALSTLSQLGVMMMVLSVGLNDLAFFHLINHALFKAMLFLCAGSVIHNMNGWQDIRKLNGLIMISPFLSMVIMLGSLSLMGFPFLSGFYSKDMILEILYMMNNSFIMLLMLLLGTMFSVMYSLRLMYYLFFNKNYMFDMNFHESTEMNIVILIMSFMVVFFGGTMSWLLFPVPSVIFLLSKMKLLNFFLVTSTLMFTMYFFMEMIFYYDSEMKDNNFIVFITEMFFLKTLSSEMFLKNFFFIKNYLDSEIWIEEMGSLGINKDLVILMFKFLKLNLLGVVKMLMMFITIFVLMMFIW